MQIWCAHVYYLFFGTVVTLHTRKHSLNCRFYWTFFFLLENDLHSAQRQRKEGSGSCEALGSPGQVKTCWMTGSRAGGGDKTEVTSEFIPPRGCSVKARLSWTLTDWWKTSKRKKPFSGNQTFHTRLRPAAQIHGRDTKTLLILKKELRFFFPAAAAEVNLLFWLSVHMIRGSEVKG